eukprot:2046741-Amphidinium_carterae.1
MVHLVPSPEKGWTFSKRPVKTLAKPSQAKLGVTVTLMAVPMTGSSRAIAAMIAQLTVAGETGRSHSPSHWQTQTKLLRFLHAIQLEAGLGMRTI